MSAFQAKVRPQLHPTAAELVRIYEATPGSTGPGCCPEALAEVIVHLSIGQGDPSFMRRCAALLRGKES